MERRIVVHTGRKPGERLVEEMEALDVPDVQVFTRGPCDTPAQVLEAVRDIEQAKIHWAPRLRPQLLKQLYDSDAAGLRDLELCDEVGMILYMRCRTFALVHRNQVECPVCRTVFEVSPLGQSHCPRAGCDWYTTRAAYAASIKNHYAFHGRAVDAFLSFYQNYPKARTYRDKMLLIDRLIHSFHVNEKTGTATKSVASKLLEGNKKAVVRFLDELSARDPDEKQGWRLAVAGTIDRHVLRTDPLEQEQPPGPLGPASPANPLGIDHTPEKKA